MSHVPISPTSPWYHFSREGIGSLARREWMGEWISPEDVLQRVVDANPDAGSDARLQFYVERVVKGEIKACPTRRCLAPCQTGPALVGIWNRSHCLLDQLIWFSFIIHHICRI